MSREVYEGRTNVYWATAVANKNAPTVAEITAAVALTNFVTKDGVAVNLATNNVDNASIAETFDAEVVGSYGAGLELTLFRDTTDTAWNLCVYGTNGFVIIDRGNPSGTFPSVGHKVEVYPSQMHEPAMENSASNTNKRFKETFAVTSAPAQKATVA
jgi:hypothetical protein